MNRVKIAPTYDLKWAHYTRPSPLSDNKIELLQQDLLSAKIDHDISDNVYINFKTEAEDWILKSKLNHLTGFEDFSRKDICIGCTQFIDTIYMKGPVQTIEHDYKYHERLGIAHISQPSNLIKNIPLILAMPFPSIGAIHPNMESILNECLEKSIDVHIDGAWVTCCRDISFNFSHPAIKSFAISLSKGLGLGWNRIGVRWSKEANPDAITIMNDFHMNNRALAMIGLHYLRNLPPDYLWNAHEDHYYKVCKDFNLEPTNSIYLAKKDGSSIGVSPLIRYLENAK